MIIIAADGPGWLTKEKKNTAAVDLRHRLQCYDDVILAEGFCIIGVVDDGVDGFSLPDRLEDVDDVCCSLVDFVEWIDGCCLLPDREA